MSPVLTCRRWFTLAPAEAATSLNTLWYVSGRFLIAVVASNVNLMADDEAAYPEALPAQFNASATTYQVDASADGQFESVTPERIRVTSQPGQTITKTFSLKSSGSLLVDAEVIGNASWLKVEERVRSSVHDPVAFDVTATCPADSTLREAQPAHQ